METVEARFRKHYVVDESGCWLWTSTVTNSGYGLFHWGNQPRRQRLAHRVAWELVNGPIPEGMQIDHRCRVTLCVNPAHLEVVTVKENYDRSRPYRPEVYRGDRCMKGHDLSDPANVYMPPSGKRECAVCRRERRKAMSGDGRYVYVRAWGYMLGSSISYVDDQVKLARKEGAPANATYRDTDAEGGRWHTVDDISDNSTGRNTRARLEKILEDRGWKEVST